MFGSKVFKTKPGCTNDQNHRTKEKTANGPVSDAARRKTVQQPETHLFLLHKVPRGTLGQDLAERVQLELVRVLMGCSGRCVPRRSIPMLHRPIVTVAAGRRTRRREHNTFDAGLFRGGVKY